MAEGGGHLFVDGGVSGMDDQSTRLTLRGVRIGERFGNGEHLGFYVGFRGVVYVMF